MLAYLLSSINFISIAHCDAPQPWELSFQDGGSPIFEGINVLHDSIMFDLVLMVIGVAWMLTATITNFNSKNHPISLKFSNHGTIIELIWTITPALILIAIAFPSFRLLYLMDETISPEITVKAIGRQWFWDYQYSDYINDSGESIEFSSYMVPENDLELGAFRLLEVDSRLVLPVDTHIRFVITAADVIHSFAVPSLGLKVDAIPGR